MWRLPLSFAFNFNMRPYMMDEFISAVKRRFGERAIIQFEDFSNDNGKRLLERYATQAAVFNDDIQAGGVLRTSTRPTLNLLLLLCASV